MTSSGGKSSTIASQFSRQLEDLMLRLNATTPQFVRCLKPNSVKSAGVFDSSLCLQQLRYSGVFEVTAITKSGFPFRYSHQAFVNRYRCLVPSLSYPGLDTRPTPGMSPPGGDEPPPLPGDLSSRDDCPPPLPPDAGQGGSGAASVDWSGAAAALIAGMPEGLNDQSRLLLGKTMVLWRVKEHERLELLHNLAVEQRVVQLQTYARRRLARRQRSHAAKARRACEEATAVRDAVQLQAGQGVVRCGAAL